jgi:hypothetical protein
MRRFYISSNHDVFVDDYNQGELENVNWYNLDSIISADNINEAIQKYFNDKLYYSFDIDHAYIPHTEDESVPKNVLHYSVLVDVDNSQASENEIELWKEDKLKLYVDNIQLIINELVEVTI